MRIKFYSENLNNRAQPPIQWVQGVKRSEREPDHTPPSNAEVKNSWSYTFSLPIRLHGVVTS
jgi:hypothetical protein